MFTDRETVSLNIQYLVLRIRIFIVHNSIYNRRNIPWRRIKYVFNTLICTFYAVIKPINSNYRFMNNGSWWHVMDVYFN